MTTTPQLKPEVLEAMEMVLYSKIIDELNAVEKLSVGRKMNVMANVISSIGSSLAEGDHAVRARFTLQMIKGMAQMELHDD